MAFRDEDIAEELAQFDPWERQMDGVYASLVRMGRPPKVTKAPNVCAVCPKPLKQAVEGRSKIYCSRRCREVASYERRKTRMPPKPPRIRLCAQPRGRTVKAKTARHVCLICPTPIVQVASAGRPRVFCSVVCRNASRAKRGSA